MLDKITYQARKVPVEPLYSPRTATILGADFMTDMEKFFSIRMDDGKPLDHMPGQFVQLSIFGLGEAPISISSSPTSKKKDIFEVCVRRVGTFTRALHNLNKGDRIGVRGPFGNGFPIDKMKANDLLLVAGGLGIVPLRSLINYIIDRRKEFGNVLILLGCKSPGEMLFLDEIEEWKKMADLGYSCTVDRADPDWKGNVGLITELIPGVNIDPYRTYVACVGPPVMYKFVIAELLGKGIPKNQILLSLERRMRCGLGKCGHCQVNHIYVCQEGPVFGLDEIEDVEEAL
jgi:sulfhydrogenase subunit gamma (sulfur reductase)